MTDYGRPPTAEANRQKIEARLADLRGDGARETLTVELRGELVHLPMITMPAGELYYNPATHRVRAQRSHNPELDARVTATPWDLQAQDYLGYLLKAQPVDPLKRDPRYDELVQSLREYGQNEPGLITRDGVLVNGNTRRAALLETSGMQTNMRVGVLPPSAGWADVADIELALQLRKEHMREYSFVNRLLAVHELTANGAPASVIAAKFRSKTATVELERWVYGLVTSLIERSRNDDGSRLSFVAFEDHAERLRELARKYAKESATRPDAAECCAALKMPRSEALWVPMLVA